MKVKIKKLDPAAVVPKYAKVGDAGLDLVAISRIHLPSKGCYDYGTGLAIEIPEGYVGLIFPRSSIRNYNQLLTNHVGVIDSGYRGEIRFSFKNIEPGIDDKYEVGNKVGQLIIIPYPKIELEEVEELSSTERGTGGFGSSGK